MQLLSDLLVTFLTAYLSFTGTLAANIETFFAPAAEPPTFESTLPETFSSAEPTLLPSSIGTNLPDILLTDPTYQQATLAGAAGLAGATAAEPIHAIVNIFCTFMTDTYIRTTTGTGFFIDPDGIIMTNAHVAQFLLLEETAEMGEAECIIRDGSPASARYHAELLYLPPSWVVANATVMHQEQPLGTGERDYALLYVSESVRDEPLPAIFPALGYDASLLSTRMRGATVTAAGYPATALLEHGSSADLTPQAAETSISELYTFGSNYADVFSIKGSAVGAEGASGGPVLNDRGEVIGVIVTRGDDTIDGAGSLRAITLSHINRTIKEETGFSLAENLTGNLPYRSEVFTTTMAPFLLRILEQAR